MENRITILNELREISPVVSGAAQQQPYTVPAGYFEGLADQLLQLVKGGEEALPVLPTANNPYEAPQGYFEGLADNILQRIKAGNTEVTLSPALQQAKQTPYKVPQGYFEGLAGQLLQRIQTSNTPYQVPAGYFENLADTVLQQIKTATSEPVLSPALLTANNNPYEVPQDYFNSLPATLLSRVKADEAANASEELEMLSPLLSRIGKKTPFSTPAGYFEELGENAIAGAQAIDFVNVELENLSPLMNSLRNQQVYEVPTGYFEQLPGRLLQAVGAQQPAKVVSMSVGRKVMRYAAAAVAAGVIITAGYFYLGHSDKGGLPGKQPQLANNLNTEEVKKTDVVKAGELDSISDEMLEKYLENQTAAPAETAAAATNSVNNSTDITTTDIKDMLADVSDEDLKQYLDKYSTIKDIQTN